MIILLMSHKFNGLVTKIFCNNATSFFTLNEIYLQLYLLGTLVYLWKGPKKDQKTNMDE